MNFNSRYELKTEILIVDDTPYNLRLLSMILSTNGYEVRKAINGKMAIESIKARPPSLILLDIKMPEMNGYETCERLKENPEYQNIPIIFISALDDVTDKVKAFSIGGVDYITKPFHQEEILARIENQIRLQFLKNELEKKNRSLHDLNRKLEESNQRLNDFAHVVSHDLKQPIQSIMGFSNLILMQYKSSLDESIVRYLDRINQAGDRMQGFISNLLDFAQMEKGDRPFYPVDCTAVMTQVVDNLQGQIQDINAQVVYDPLPTVMGHETQLVQLFQNIIGNALKYFHPERTPNIQITVDSTGEMSTIRIQDNGIGIAPEFLPTIFDAFKRAHQGEYDGHGIGLATCQKITELHHGTISVTSELGQGSIFSLTLPAITQCQSNIEPNVLY